MTRTGLRRCGRLWVVSLLVGTERLHCCYALVSHASDTVQVSKAAASAAVLRWHRLLVAVNVPRLLLLLLLSAPEAVHRQATVGLLVAGLRVGSLRCGCRCRRRSAAVDEHRFGGLAYVQREFQLFVEGLAWCDLSSVCGRVQLGNYVNMFSRYQTQTEPYFQWRPAASSTRTRSHRTAGRPHNRSPAQGTRRPHLPCSCLPGRSAIPADIPPCLSHSPVDSTIYA